MRGLHLTLGHHWVDHYLSGIVLLHTLLGYDVSITPKTEPTIETLIRVLREVAAGTYAPSDYFKAGPAPQRSLIVQPPLLNPGERYALISLNASTARGQFVSTPTGGVVFEDPLWSILAAHAVSKKLLRAVPLADDNLDLWKRVSLVVEAVRQGTYNPQDFLGIIDGFVPPGTPPKFELISVESSQVSGLRDRGVQSLKVAVPPKFFELFQPPPGIGGKTR